MSLRRAREGPNPNVTASPPQKGSTRRRLRYGTQRGSKCGTNHRLPPAHLRGGVEAHFRALFPNIVAGAAILFITRSILPPPQSRKCPISSTFYSLPLARLPAGPHPLSRLPRHLPALAAHPPVPRARGAGLHADLRPAGAACFPFPAAFQEARRLQRLPPAYSRHLAHLPLLRGADVVRR